MSKEENLNEEESEQKETQPIEEQVETQQLTPGCIPILKTLEKELKKKK